jgi:hypothetical protein
MKNVFYEIYSLKMLFSWKFNCYIINERIVRTCMWPDSFDKLITLQYQDFCTWTVNQC